MTPQEKPSVSLVLPCYNEEANIAEAVERCSRALAAATSRYEIIIVDDASTDGSARLALDMAGRDGRVRVLRNEVNLGVGIGILRGLSSATGDIVVHNAMDLPLAPEDIPEILRRFPAADVLVVVRKDRSAHSPYRKLTSLVNYWLIRLLFGARLRDMNFVQAYKREVLAAVKTRSRSPAFTTPELLIRLVDRGFRVEELVLPFHRRRRGTANYGKVRDILWTLADMVSFRLEPRG